MQATSMAAGRPVFEAPTPVPMSPEKTAGDGSRISGPVVQTAAGAVRGVSKDGLQVFRGIPYAEPLDARTRWLAPRRRAPWSGVLDATDYGPVCHQYNAKMPGRYPRARRRYIESIRCQRPEGEDYLLLNVWTPRIDPAAPLPVMVYIHGGSLTQGAAFELYDGSAFAKKQTVAVVIQYRLGPPGWLHGSTLFKDGFCADNRGFLDQLAALEWVRENIAAFGGDAANVTLFGESAGAFSVFQLMASPMAKGLFRRAIAMGGNPNGHAPAAEYHALTRDVLHDVGIRPGDEGAMEGLDIAGLERIQAAVGKRSFGKNPPATYGSIGRLRVNGQGAATGTTFQPVAPTRARRTVTPNDIDLMLGTCAGDGRLMSLMLPLPKKLVARIFASRLPELFPDADPGALRAQYRRAMPRTSELGVFEQMNNDAIFRMPTIAAAEDHAVGHPGRTFLYQVDYPSVIPGLGAIHGIEVALLFNASTGRNLLAQDEETRRLSDLMVEAWTSFARTGVPSAAAMPEWRAYEVRQRNTMVFDRETRLMPDWGGELRRYWSP